MPAELSTFMERIGGVLEQARGRDLEPPTWTDVEQVLTDGYACVHRLEAERSRIAGRVRGLDREIGALRSLLAELREHGAALREAAF
jgi:hypothetical protein